MCRFQHVSTCSEVPTNSPNTPGWNTPDAGLLTLMLPIGDLPPKDLQSEVFQFEKFQHPLVAIRLQYFSTPVSSINLVAKMVQGFLIGNIYGFLKRCVVAQHCRITRRCETKLVEVSSVNSKVLLIEQIETKSSKKELNSLEADLNTEFQSRSRNPIRTETNSQLGFQNLHPNAKIFESSKTRSNPVTGFLCAFVHIFYHLLSRRSVEDLG